jgi:arylsulfatase A-like enzyme
MDRLIERTFLSYTVGALVGAFALVVEVAASGLSATWGALAAYMLVGGVLGSAARWFFAWRLRARAARTGAAAVLAAFGSLHLLYFANVRLLPGEHYLSARSLALDAAILLAMTLPAVWLARWTRAEAARERWGRPAACFGALVLVASLSLLGTHLPRDESAVFRSGTGPNLVLVVLDSARRDHMGFHHYAAPTSPSLDREAAGARVFDSAFAASSWTVPSVVRLLQAGAPPGTTGSGLTLSERLARRGYVTACFTDNPHLTNDRNFLRGFDRVDRSVGLWRDVLRGTVIGEVIERVSPGLDRDLTDRAIEWASHRREPFFLYLHLMDSHTPYHHPAIDGVRRPGRRIEFPVSGMSMTPVEAADIVARYDGGIRSADAAAGRLLAAVRGWGRPFLAIVTADHGESLGEAGHWFHGQTLRPELLAVPLLVIGGGVVPGRVATPVGHDAIPATLLAAAGDRPGAGIDLRSEAGNGVVDGALPPSLRYRIVGHHKVVVDADTGRRLLFDLAHDPGEVVDRSHADPELAAKLSDDLIANHPVRIDSDRNERLHALGYSGW